MKILCLTAYFLLVAPVFAQQDAGLQLTIESSKTTLKPSEAFSFTVTFHNEGVSSLLLNGGELLGNGAQLWSNLEVELVNAAGQRVPMLLGWGAPGVAGRIYFLGLPLRPGSSHRLLVKEKDYLIGVGEPLQPGRYELRCRFHGRQSTYRDPTQMPPCWEGEAVSNVLKLEVLSE